MLKLFCQQSQEERENNDISHEIYVKKYIYMFLYLNVLNSVK